MREGLSLDKLGVPLRVGLSLLVQPAPARLKQAALSLTRELLMRDISAFTILDLPHEALQIRDERQSTTLPRPAMQLCLSRINL